MQFAIRFDQAAIAAGIGGLIGPPLAGELIDRQGYAPALVMAVVFAFIGFAILLPLRVDASS